MLHLHYGFPTKRSNAHYDGCHPGRGQCVRVIMMARPARIDPEPYRSNILWCTQRLDASVCRLASREECGMHELAAVNGYHFDTLTTLCSAELSLQRRSWSLQVPFTTLTKKRGNEGMEWSRLFWDPTTNWSTHRQSPVSSES